MICLKHRIFDGRQLASQTDKQLFARSSPIFQISEGDSRSACVAGFLGFVGGEGRCEMTKHSSTSPLLSLLFIFFNDILLWLFYKRIM